MSNAVEAVLSPEELRKMNTYWKVQLSLGQHDLSAGESTAEEDIPKAENPFSERLWISFVSCRRANIRVALRAVECRA